MKSKGTSSSGDKWDLLELARDAALHPGENKWTSLKLEAKEKDI